MPVSVLANSKWHHVADFAGDAGFLSSRFATVRVKEQVAIPSRPAEIEHLAD